MGKFSNIRKLLGDKDLPLYEQTDDGPYRVYDKSNKYLLHGVDFPAYNEFIKNAKNVAIENKGIPRVKQLIKDPNLPIVGKSQENFLDTLDISPEYKNKLHDLALYEQYKSKLPKDKKLFGIDIDSEIVKAYLQDIDPALLQNMSSAEDEQNLEEKLKLAKEDSDRIARHSLDLIDSKQKLQNINFTNNPINEPGALAEYSYKTKRINIPKTSLLRLKERPNIVTHELLHKKEEEELGVKNRGGVDFTTPLDEQENAGRAIIKENKAGHFTVPAESVTGNPDLDLFSDRLPESAAYFKKLRELVKDK